MYVSPEDFLKFIRLIVSYTIDDEDGLISSEVIDILGSMKKSVIVYTAIYGRNVTIAVFVSM